MSTETEPGPIDCDGKRVIRFDEQRRFDSGGGVPDYRVIDLVNEADTNFLITEEFNTGQIRAKIRYTMRLIDPDRIELAMSPGGTLTSSAASSLQAPSAPVFRACEHVPG